MLWDHMEEKPKFSCLRARAWSWGVKSPGRSFQKRRQFSQRRSGPENSMSKCPGLGQGSLGRQKAAREVEVWDK